MGKCKKCRKRTFMWRNLCKKCSSYHYLEEVEVIDGFYKGQKGRIMEGFYGIRESGYYLRLNSDDKVLVRASFLKRRKGE